MKHFKTISELDMADGFPPPENPLFSLNPLSNSNNALKNMEITCDFYIIALNSRNHSLAEVSVGSLNASIVHPREVFAEAIKNKAASVIFSHNHPSGDPEPSEDDIVMTKRLVEAGKILGIEVVDHIIVTKNGFSSFKEKSLI